MPNIADVYAALEQFNAIAIAAQRRYAVDDFIVELRIAFLHGGNGPDQIVPRLVVVDHGGDWVPVGDMSPHHLMKVAELKSIFDDWASGKIDEMPPSTYVDIPTDS